MSLCKLIKNFSRIVLKFEVVFYFVGVPVISKKNSDEAESVLYLLGSYLWVKYILENY